MGRCVYSVVLSEDVVREIDKIAYLNGSNRSNTIDRILAEYVSITTPEKVICDMIDDIYKTVLGFDGFKIQAPQSSKTISMQTALTFKYNPTLKYSVGLYRMPENGNFGELKVVIRTQNITLLSRIYDFLQVWTLLENKHLGHVDSKIEEGKYYRKLMVGRGISGEQYSKMISEYINAFDTAIKTYLNCSDNAAASNKVALIYNNCIVKGSITI